MPSSGVAKSALVPCFLHATNMPPPVTITSGVVAAWSFEGYRDETQEGKFILCVYAPLPANRWDSTG
jgi:hypothetical protein